MDDHAERQAEGINEQMAFAPGERLPTVIAVPTAALVSAGWYGSGHRSRRGAQRRKCAFLAFRPSRRHVCLLSFTYRSVIMDL